MSLDPVETLQELIQIASVNPMGREVAGPNFGEERLTNFLQALCEKQGWAWLRQEVHLGRENLLTLIPGVPSAADGGELVLWDVHQDTVSADGMIVDAFAGNHRDGRIYGRGACDVKGSMAAMIAALSRHPISKPQQSRPTIAVAFTVNEECGFTGAQSLCRLWSQPDGSRPTTAEMQITSGNLTPEAAFPKCPDCAIVAEPTDLNVVVAHQGVVRWRCHVDGRAAHSSRPDEGINAIYAMTHVIQAIEQYHRELTTSAREHPLCGRPSVCVSTIRGGVGINIVPARATIEIDRRVSPGEDPIAAYQHLVQHVADEVDVGRAQVLHDPPFMRSVGLSEETNRSLADRLAQVVHRSGRTCELLGVPYGTDAAAIAATGIPTVVFGPGSIRQAHTADEFIDVSELKRGADLFEAIAQAGLR